MQTSSINPVLAYISAKILQHEQFSVHGIHFAISDWAPDQPSNGPGEDCASIYAGFDFRWIDADCSLPVYYICMYWDGL